MTDDDEIALLDQVFNLHGDMQVADRLKDFDCHFEHGMAAGGAPCPDAWRTVRDHDNEGLYLFGDSRSGKTCAALASFYRTQRPSPENYELWAASELRDALAETGRETMLATLCQAGGGVLVDDLGHFCSAPFLEFMRLLLDRLESPRLVITSQYTPNELLQKWRREGKLAEAVVNRILQLCVGVRFDRGGKS